MKSAQLNDIDLRKSETFQLKALRKVLSRKTTYVARESTNAKVSKSGETYFLDCGDCESSERLL